MHKKIRVIKKILKKTRQPPKMFYYLFSASEFDGNSKTIRKPVKFKREYVMFKRFFDNLCAAVGNDIARVERW